VPGRFALGGAGTLTDEPAFCGTGSAAGKLGAGGGVYGPFQFDGGGAAAMSVL